MAVNRIWFPAIPTDGVGAADRAILGIGYGGISLSVPAVATLWPFTEPVPTRPGAIDGAYTEGTQDGVWTEYPAHGAYTSVGYLSEFKPFHRATRTLEAVPSAPYSPALADGSYEAGGEVLAGGAVGGRLLEGKPI